MCEKKGHLKPLTLLAAFLCRRLLLREEWGLAGVWGLCGVRELAGVCEFSESA